jgi:hypothetical protein
MVDNDEHLLKQLLPIEVTVFGIEMNDNDEHSLKQLLRIEVIVFGIEMVVMMKNS